MTDTEAAQTPLLIEVADAVARVTLNRPEKLNALDHGLVRELRSTIARLDEDPGVRAIVLTGSGRGFCAGADLSGGPSDAQEVVRELYNPLIETMVGAATPLVAAINGPVAGAGVSIALACDLRIAADSARFELSFVRVGLVPDAGATWLLPRLVGASRAAEMALLGRRVLADEAASWGLVSRVVPQAEVLTEAEATASALAALSSSVGATKALLLEAATHPLAEHLEQEARAQGIAQKGPDYAEARAAFREKRAPTFTRP